MVRTESAGSVLPLRRTAWAAGAAAVLVVALAGALSLSGSTEPAKVGDPGFLVRWGLPAATAVHHLAMSVVLASLVFSTFVLPPGAMTRARGRITAFPAGHNRVITVGSIAAVAWLASAGLVLVLSYADIIGQPPSTDSAFIQQFGYFASGTGAGRARLAVVLLAGVVTLLLLAKPGWTGSVLAGALTAAAVVPLSLVGHASSATVPWVAIVSVGFHILGVSVWVGGVVLLGALSDLLHVDHSAAATTTAEVFERFSTLAGIAFAVVFGSGVVNSLTRLGDVAALGTPYGTLILLKVVATLALGVIGYFHRRWISAEVLGERTPTAPAWRLIGVEILIMSATMALAVTLAQTTPPAQHDHDRVMGAVPLVAPAPR